MAGEKARAEDHRAETASPKEKFALLFEMLRFYYSSPLEGLARTSAILLVIAGWMVSSESVQRQLDLNSALRYLGLAFIIVGEGLYLYISWRVYLLSNITFGLLTELAYMDAKYFANYRIRGRVIAAYWLASILVAASAGTLIMMIKPTPFASNSISTSSKGSVGVTAPNKAGRAGV